MKNEWTQILIHEGSTHNFIQPAFVQQMKFLVEPSTFFKVMVDNDKILECSRLVRKISLKIQQHMFEVDFYIIPVQGINMAHEV